MHVRSDGLSGPTESIPAWCVQRTRNIGLLNNGRLKILLAAITCILLGYTTISLISSQDNFNAKPSSARYGYGYTGSRNGPETLSASAGMNELLREGKGNTAVEMRPQVTGKESKKMEAGKNSISGALKDLHNAVSDKFTSWKSWGPDEASNEIHTSHPFVGNSETANQTSEELTSPGTVHDRVIIGKCTIVLYGSTLYERAVRTHGPHDRLNGYSLHVLRQSLMDDVWSKPAYILSLLLRELTKPETERLQWILWFDADTVMLNPYVPLEMFLPPSPEFDHINLLVTHDWNGLNNGVFPVRVCQWSVDLFAAIVSFRQYRPDEPLTFRDQSAMNMLLQEKKFAAHTMKAPQRLMRKASYSKSVVNFKITDHFFLTKFGLKLAFRYQGAEIGDTIAPFQVRRGDFLVHFAGVLDREERLLYWLDRAEQHLPDWEIEIQHTSYPTEVKDFWAKQSEQRKSKSKELMELRSKANELLTKVASKMGNYEDRLQEGETSIIREKEAALKGLLEIGEDTIPESLNDAIEALDQAINPLQSTIDEAHKVLMKEAHDAIFEAEEDLLANAGVSNPEITEIQAKTSSLKDIVLQPHWEKQIMVSAIEKLKQARTKLQDKLSELKTIADQSSGDV